MKKILHLTVISCLLGITAFPFALAGQGRQFKREGRFKAGIMLGLNMSQIDGDKYSGFNRPGIEGGLVGITVLNRNSILSTELMFSQRGSRPTEKETRKRSEYNVRIRLNYIEVPVVYHHLYNEREDGSFSYSYHVGLSFGRLVSTKIEESAFNPVFTVKERNSLIKDKDDIRKNDLSLIAGATFYFNRYFGVTLRGTFSLTPFYYPPETSALRSYYLTLAGNYYLH